MYKKTIQPLSDAEHQLNINSCNIQLLVFSTAVSISRAAGICSQTYMFKQQGYACCMFVYKQEDLFPIFLCHYSYVKYPEMIIST